MVNTVTNRVVRLLGKDETVRFMHLTLYQGAPAKKGLTTAVSDSRCVHMHVLLISLFVRQQPRRRTLCWQRRPYVILPSRVQVTNASGSTCSPVQSRSTHHIQYPLTFMLTSS